MRPKINLGVAKNVTKTSLNVVTEKNVFESVAIRIVLLFQFNLIPSLKGLVRFLKLGSFEFVMNRLRIASPGCSGL